MPTYTYTAAQCPAVQAPLTFQLPTAGTPAVLESFATGDRETVGTKLNANAVLVELVSQCGAGGIAAGLGLDLEVVSGLTCRVTAGIAAICGPVSLETSFPLTVTDNGRNHVWLTQGGTPTLVTGNLLPPGTPACYLGSFVASAGSVTVDYSGRMEIKGGFLYRRTADAAAPGDTPNANVRFYHQTAGGLYLWTGSAYSFITGVGDAYTVRIDASDTADYLGNKLAPGTGITITDTGSTLRIDATAIDSVETVTFNAYQVADLSAGTNYRFVLDFSADGVFGDTGFEAVLVCDQAGVVITPETASRTTGKASWIVYLDPDHINTGTYGDEYDLALTATLYGVGWTGATTGPFDGDWSYEAVGTATASVDLASDVTGTLDIPHGGTGATSASAARTALGLGTMSTQNADNAAITGGLITGVALTPATITFQDAAAVRGNLGLGTLATQNAGSVAITGGSITGLTNLEAAASSLYNHGTVTTAKTINWAQDILVQKSVQKLTLGADPITLTWSNATCNRVLILEIVQDGSGSRTVTWPASVLWEGGSAPTLSTTGGAVDVIALWSDGVNQFGQIFGLDFS